MDRARARTQPGAAACAAVLKLDTTAIHANPPKINEKPTITGLLTNARTNITIAKSKLAPSTRTLFDIFRRTVGNKPAPETAPAPMQPRRTPYPNDPKPNPCLACNGKRAHRALAQIINDAVRTNVARSSGEYRT